ncbi:MAG TPA: DUF6049 family protein [Acidimicrobiia bacterium]|nr:DUF6049 family protein [Acidimicrobiia bacterium]
MTRRRHSRAASPLRRRAGAALLVALVAAVGTLSASPLSAQTATPTPKLVLVGQDAWTPSGGVVTLRLRADNAPPGLTLALTTHAQVVSRSAFDDTVDGGALGSTLRLTQLPFDDLPVDPTTGARTLTIALDDLSARLNARQSSSGVFPLEVELRDADNRAVSHFVTHLVVADVTADGALAVGQPLDVAWVWPIVADPAYLPNGKPDPDVASEMFAGGRLSHQADLIAANTDVPLTLAPSPDTLQAWSALAAADLNFAAGANALRAAVPRNQVLAGPYVPLDLPSLIANGLGGAVPSELAGGVSTLEEYFGALLDPSTAAPGPVDGPSLAALRDASRRRLVLPSSALSTVDEQFTPARPYTVQTDPRDESTAMTVVASDEGIERFLTSDDAPALRAAHVLAALAVIAGEQPNRARGVAIMNPSRWDAPTDLVDAVLAGLRTNPMLRPVTVDTLFTQVAPATVDDQLDGARVVRGLSPVAAAAPPVKSTRYVRALFERDAVGHLFPPTDERVQRGDRAVLAVLSSSWANPSGRRKADALLDGIGASVDDFLAHIRVPEQSTVTLTSNTAEIPITFNNDTGQPVRVRIRLESNRLLFPDGAERVVDLPPKNHTERIRVETRGPGTFPVTIDVTTEGGLPIQSTRLSVRSSVVSGVGVVLMIGALVFLAGWWGWDIHRRRKRRPRDDAPRATIPAPA